MLPSWATGPFEEYRARRVARHLLKYIHPGETFLDCGCGSLRMARWLSTNAQAIAFGTDVINLNRTDLSLCLSAGEHLPFASNSLDTICLIFVLHHVADPIATLRECLRVTRHLVVVAEDVYQSSLELGLLRTLDWLGNRSVSRDMQLPFGFRREQAWTAIFDQLEAYLVAVEHIRPVPWRPSRHRLFVLTKQRPGTNRLRQ